MKNRVFRTDFLVPDQNELTGMATVLDVFNPQTPYNYSKSGEEADMKAIAHDWASVGEDLSNVIKIHQL